MTTVRARLKEAGPLLGQHHLSLWFMPAVAVLVSLTAGAFLATVEVGPDSPIVDLVFHGDSGDARQLLTVVAGTMITVTGLVFVLTVIVLQLASTQFSPRLLRSFLRDRGTQVVLATFVSTFAYSLAGLHTVGRVGADGTPFVPRLAVSGAMALSLVSIGMLMYYIQHITDSIRIETIIVRVAAATADALHRHHPLAAQTSHVPAPSRPEDAIAIPARTSGYVQHYHDAALVRVATANQVTIALVHPIGHYVVASRPLAHVWPDRERSGPVDVERVSREIARATLTESERYEDRDVAFGVRQLVDIAIRSVAPSINDPYTAVQTIQPLSVLMVDIVKRDLRDHTLTGPDGRARVVEPITDFESYLALAAGHIRQAASNRPRVVAALMRLLEDVAGHCTNERQRAAVREQIELLMHDAARDIAQPADIVETREIAASALAQLELQRPAAR